jgi:uncharacterized protein YidB (DUF937 family)
LAALLGLLAVAGYQNRDKIGAMLHGAMNNHGDEPGAQGGDPRMQGQGGFGGAGGLGGLLGGLTGGGGMGSGGLLGGITGGGIGGMLANGLQELMGRLHQGGLGQQASSWVSQGPNEQVSPGQLRQAIDPALIDQLSQQTGLDREEILQRLSSVLPQAVDSMTPSGQLPQPGRPA